MDGLSGIVMRRRASSLIQIKVVDAVIPARPVGRGPGIHNPGSWLWIPGSLALLSPRKDERLVRQLYQQAQRPSLMILMLQRGRRWVDRGDTDNDDGFRKRDQPILRIQRHRLMILMWQLVASRRVVDATVRLTTATTGSLLRLLGFGS
jgi:hypothetical protein